MAQEIQRFTWCDVCISDDVDKEPAVTFTVAIDTAAPVALDLCEVHRKALLDPLAEALTAHGYRADMEPAYRNPALKVGGHPGRRGTGVPCLWCPESYGSVSGLAGHMHKVHAFPARKDGRANLSAAYGVGGGCPYCGRLMNGTRPAQLGIHMARSHPGEPSGLPASFVRARELGDPHGVVAKVVALVDPATGKVAKPRRRR
jgi:hypothetical protein